MRRSRRGPPDFILFVVTLALLGIGLVMVFSSSAVTTSVSFDDAYYYLKKQLIWAVLGIIIMFVIMKINYNRIKDLAAPLLVITIVCLVLVITPLGTEVKGSSRFLGIAPFVFTPSELAKLAMVMFMAKSLSINLDKIRNFKNGLLPYLVLLAVVCGLIMMQPDLGTTVAIAGTFILMISMAGANMAHLGGIALAGMAGIGAAIAVAPYRMERWYAFLDPWQYASDEGFQTIQSLYALGSGGLFGMGLGRSRQKFFYLPEQYTDFVYAILGEELGFVGAFLVLALFLLFAWRGFRIALNAPDIFGSLLAAGITVMIVLQAAINIGVVTGVLPVTGITLPFISYGGTSLLFTLAGVGLLLNISRYSEVK
ncbi:MAG: putative lipid II flippase FtsW [Syntrophomonadaceae bacterium]|jgi:cell division protein FtsW|nr:putative lipid II flippase FtsW [Syntrophomonadaceae bacterium]